jgi:hypothetical protein
MYVHLHAFFILICMQLLQFMDAQVAFLNSDSESDSNDEDETYQNDSPDITELSDQEGVLISYVIDLVSVLLQY